MGPEPRCFPFFGVCRLVVLKETEFLVSFLVEERPCDFDLDFERFGGPDTRGVREHAPRGNFEI